MKKFFQLLGFLTLVGISFFYTEKTALVVREMDDIMITLKETAKEDITPPIDARIIKDTIVPGMSGKKIDINLSYQKMKQYGTFQPKLIVYENVLPKISVMDYPQKYIIGGNPKKNQITFIFLVNEKTKLDNIRFILKKEHVNANFFIDGLWLEKNNQEMLELIEEGNVIGNLSYNQDYTNSSFIWMNTIISRVGNQKIGYCYTEEKKKEVLEACKLQKNYTILPTAAIKQKFYRNLKENLKPGSIVSFPVTDELEEQLPTMLSFVKSKGYDIVTLNQMLEET